MVHPSGHWVVKRLLKNESVSEGEEEEGEGVSEGEEEGEGVSEGEEEGEGEISFAERILDRVSADDIRAWTATNRGAFVTCR